ncbi:MAG: hypothetical protein K2K08_06625, partial [Paramuribaculum sp.]|nr:hypothetical protein [Paramuribaculum sp.]
MRVIKHLYLIAAVISLSGQAFAAEIPDSISYSVEGTATFSTGQNTPFWLVNNRFGLSSIEKNNGYLRAGLFKEANRNGKKFAWGAGVDLA